MDKRTRSPAYPAISLPDAIEKLSALFAALQTHPAPREVIARGMGYTGLNGASASAIAALGKYGLLERFGGDELRISERGMSILHPHDLSERASAIKAAALEPKLFAELQERFPGKMPNEELLRNYLVRNGYAASAVRSVILSYRQTLEFLEAQPDLSPEAPVLEEHDGSAERADRREMAPRPPEQSLDRHSADRHSARLLGRYDFEDGSCVQITVTGLVSTRDALDMVDTLVRMKRAELDRRTKPDTCITKEAYATSEARTESASDATHSEDNPDDPPLLGYLKVP